MTQNRNDFSRKTVQQIAKRAGWLCSFPECRKHTIGATEDGSGEVNIGTAAHICAAAPGGPRYDPAMSVDERSSAANGIWMCRDHGKVIDSDVKHFTTEILKQWKKQAEKESFLRVLQGGKAPVRELQSNSELGTLLRTAAQTDLDKFRHIAKWPSTSVPLQLMTEGASEPVAADDLARAVTTIDDLLLVAGPGMGKTTTVFQIAEEILKLDNGIPLIVLLNDWSIDDKSLLDSILSRPAYRGITEENFRQVALQKGVVILLDGWNELDDGSRRRARVQIESLKAELTELGLVVSTRKARNENLMPPFRGRRIDVLALSDEQQMAIAQSMKGSRGKNLVDQAWRTPGVRELVGIPLYLTSLLSLPDDVSFPETKDEVLRHFVGAQEKEVNRAEILDSALQDFQQDYLNGLALFAMQTGHTTIPDVAARETVANVSDKLAAARQIEDKPNPTRILDVLVNNHILMRTGSQQGVSFQHHQFQEWYASHYVEQQILENIDDLQRREGLKRTIFDQPNWEESILFAVERMSRAGEQSAAACAKSIIAAFEVDPILAAEMIYRSTDQVWGKISDHIQDLVSRWHTPLKADRALRFMLMSGRPEFLSTVWPIITDPNDQVSLNALRNCRRFRCSIFGDTAFKDISMLPEEPRKVLLQEIASNSGFDGMDLVTEIAINDPSPDVKAAVVGSFAFRRADRHVAKILRSSNDQVFDLVSNRESVNQVDDEELQSRLKAAHDRQVSSEKSTHDRVRAIVLAPADRDDSSELKRIIAEIEVDKAHDETWHFVHEARRRYPTAVAEGILERVRSGKSLFYKAGKILQLSKLSVEDDALLGLAMNLNEKKNERASAAAAVLGPISVGKMIDEFLSLIPHIAKNQEVHQRLNALGDRISCVPAESLISVISARSEKLGAEEMARLAHVLSRFPDIDNDYDAPFNADAVKIIQGFVKEWGKRLLGLPDAKRWHKAEIATLASHVPSSELLPILKEMNEDNLARLSELKERVKATEAKDRDALHEARDSHTHEYLNAFLAINTQETVDLMTPLLEDTVFGPSAARILWKFWRTNNEQPKDNRFAGRYDWSDVKFKRLSRSADPRGSCSEADAIFQVVDKLIFDDDSTEAQLRGVVLGTLALRLPHGERNASIQRLRELAPFKHHDAARHELLASLILSGHEILIGDVLGGINETLEAAKTDWSVLNQNDGYQLCVWVDLIPFTDDPIKAIPIIAALAKEHSTIFFFRDMIRNCSFVPSDKVEDFLFILAENDPRFYQMHEWRDSVVSLDTPSSARRLIDVISSGEMQRSSATDDWHFVKQIGHLFGGSMELRRHVYDLLKDGATTPGLRLLARAVAENPDEDGLMVLVACETAGQKFRSWRTLESVVTENIPLEGSGGVYNVNPVPAGRLRARLLSMTTDGGATDVPAAWLRKIDNIRDDYGVPDGEPRHPDLISGKSWPIIPARGSSAGGLANADVRDSNGANPPAV